MANGLDRLERFFTYRRKGSATGSEPATPITVMAPANLLSLHHAGDPLDHQFPSPSFIRPKASRMAAREEVRVRQSSLRSASPSVVGRSSRKPSTHTRNSSGTSNSSYLKAFPARAFQTAGSDEIDRTIPSFQAFRFPKPPAHTANCYNWNSSNGQASPRSGSPPRLQVDIPIARLDTPPYSDPEDVSPSRKSFRNKQLPPLPYDNPPTPEESPKAGPIPDSQLRTSRSVDILDKTLCQAIQDQLNRSVASAPLRRTLSHSHLLPSALPPSCLPNYLEPQNFREPEFEEFFDLSDDDIAESSLESSLPSTPDTPPYLPPMPLSIAPLKPHCSPLLALQPPRPSGATTVAAFEAARIAKRYDFDLVFVVNLWSGDSPELGTLGTEVNGKANRTQQSASDQLQGRLLAAHGLHHVPSPLQISTLIHSKVLRSNGWMEYRDINAGPFGFARGYGCPFHPGQDGDHGVPVSGVKLSEQIDRGIVFAAYRKPRPGPDVLGMGLKTEQLGELYQDAEAMVEMLIDIHQTSQLREPGHQDQICEHTGPMPTQ